MRLLRRTGGPATTPELDAQLRSIFDDGRTPGAPETLYSYLREVSMEPATDRGRGILRLLAGLGHMSRTAAALTAVLIIVGAAAAVTVVLPRAMGPGAASAPAAPTAPGPPRAPAGWHSMVSFGSVEGQSAGTNWGGGMVSGNFIDPDPRIAIHVVCNGPADLIVMVSTESGDAPLNRPLQAARFSCTGEGRAELIADRGQFQGLTATLIRDQSTIADMVTFTVGIEVPDETPAPTVLR